MKTFGSLEGAAASLQGSLVSHLNCSRKGSTQDDCDDISLQVPRERNRVKDVKGRIII